MPTTSYKSKDRGQGILGDSPDAALNMIRNDLDPTRGPQRHRILPTNAVQRLIAGADK